MMIHSIGSHARDRVGCADRGGVQAPVRIWYHSASCVVPRITVQAVVGRRFREVRASYQSASCAFSGVFEVQASSHNAMLWILLFFEDSRQYW